MATCLAHIRIKDGKAADIEALARGLYAPSTGHEPGMTRYEYGRGQVPGSYHCLELFSNGYAGFLAHETAEHHEAAAEPIMALIADFKLEWVDPVRGAAPLEEVALATRAGRLGPARWFEIRASEAACPGFGPKTGA